MLIDERCAKEEREEAARQRLNERKREREQVEDARKALRLRGVSKAARRAGGGIGRETLSGPEAGAAAACSGQRRLPSKGGGASEVIAYERPRARVPPRSALSSSPSLLARRAATTGTSRPCSTLLLARSRRRANSRVDGASLIQGTMMMLVGAAPPTEAHAPATRPAPTATHRRGRQFDSTRGPPLRLPGRASSRCTLKESCPGSRARDLTAANLLRQGSGTERGVAHAVRLEPPQPTSRRPARPRLSAETGRLRGAAHFRSPAAALRDD